ILVTHVVRLTAAQTASGAGAAEPYGWMVLCGVLAVAAAVLALVLLQHRRALQRARRFEAYFNSNAEPILVLDGDLRVVESNPQAQRLLEFTGRRLHQKSLAELLRSEEPLDPAALLGTVSQKGSVALEA